MGVFARFKAYEKSHGSGGDHYRSVNISLTMIQGGYYSNVIPPTCEATLDIRIPPGLSSKTLESDLTQILEESKRDESGCAVRVELRRGDRAVRSPDRLARRTVHSSAR